jgi:hypothetical protein
VKKEQSSQAEWFLPGNLGCVATETTTSRERETERERKRKRARKRERLSLARLLKDQDLVVRKSMQFQDSIPGARLEDRGRRQWAGRETEKEAGLDQLPSPLPHALPGSGLLHPLQGARWVLAGEGEEETHSSQGCHKALISPAVGGTWVGADHLTRPQTWLRGLFVTQVC